MRKTICSILLLLVPSLGASDNEPIAGIRPVGKIEKVATGFEFVEGPAADAEGNIYFSELRAEKIFRLDTEGNLSTFLEESHRTNGLMFDSRGRLLACQSGKDRQPGIAQIVAIDVKAKRVEPIVPSYRGKPFNRVNDLVINRTGFIYFTDITDEGPQETAGVYAASPRGNVRLLIGDLSRPNGVILSPDEKTLYVLPAGSPVVMQYPLLGPGKIGSGTELCSLPYPKDSRPRGGDGLTVDTSGNLYVTVPAMSAIQVVTPSGKVLGSIQFPESPANCTFGGKDMKTLYVTARTSLYAVRMEAIGHRFAARRNSGNAKGNVPGIDIALDLCPIEKIVATARDGKEIRAFYRKPPGKGLFPSILFIHGGINSASDASLRNSLLNNVTYTRLLGSGFLVVAGDYRDYEKNPQDQGPIWDCLAILDEIEKLSQVDPESIVAYGGSGGGSIALELAGRARLAAAVCGEPATLIFAGMLQAGQFDRRMDILADPFAYYTPDKKALTRKKIAMISCPLLILHGDQHSLKELNGKIIVPELESAGVNFEYKIYPGNPHGFYWGRGTTQKTVDQYLADVHEFLLPFLKTKPVPFIEHVGR